LESQKIADLFFVRGHSHYWAQSKHRTHNCGDKSVWNQFHSQFINSHHPNLKINQYSIRGQNSIVSTLYHNLSEKKTCFFSYYFFTYKSRSTRLQICLQLRATPGPWIAKDGQLLRATARALAVTALGMGKTSLQPKGTTINAMFWCFVSCFFVRFCTFWTFFWPNSILEHGITQNQNNYRAQNEIVGHAHIGIDSACFLGLWSFQSCVWMSEEHWKVQGSRSRIQIQIWPKATDFSETRPCLSTMHRFFVHEEHEGSPLLREIDQDQNWWIKTLWSGACENRTIFPKSKVSFGKLGCHKINVFEVDEIRPNLEVFLKFPKSLLFHVSQGCTPCTRHVANALAGNLRS